MLWLPCHSQLLGVEFAANRLIYDKTRNVLYATNPSALSLTELNPLDLTTGKGLVVGPEPIQLALSDSDSTLYVGFRGIPEVAEIDVPNWEVTRHFPLGQPDMFVEDMDVQPGSESVLAV